MNRNPVAGLNAYERRHLAAHLAEVRRFEDLHALFGIESAEGGNAWYEIKQERNEAADYLADVAVAWTAAGQEQQYGLECRYALVSATWNTLASSLHPAMYPALVQRGVWSRERALAAALRTRLFRAEALVLLTPFLDGPGRDRAFTEVAEDLRNESGSILRMRLEAIGHLLPEGLVREILSRPPTVFYDGQPARDSEATLLPRLAELGHAAEARAWAERLPESPERFRALCGVARSLAPQEGLQLLEQLAAQFRPSDRISPDEASLRALARGFAALGRPDRAIESAARDQWRPTRDLTLETIARAFALAGRSDDALACAGQMEYSHRKAVVLAAVSDQLAGAERMEQLDTALELARQQWRGHVDALRIIALAEVGSRLPEPEHVLGEALDAALAQDDYGRRRSVADIAHLLTPDLLRKALSALQAIEDRAESCGVITALAEACSAEAGRRIGRTACESAAALGEAPKRWAALLKGLPIWGTGIRSEVLALLTRTADELTAESWATDEVLAFPNPLDDDVAEIVLKASQTIEDPAAQASMLKALAPCVSQGLFPRAFDLACRIQDPEHRAAALAAAAARVPEKQISELVQACAGLGDDRSDHLQAAVAARLSEGGQHGDALSGALAIDDHQQRLRALASVAKHSPDPRPAMAEMIGHLKALTWRPPSLYVGGLAGELPAGIAGPVLLAAREWAMRVGENDRDTILEDIAGPLTRAGLIGEARRAVEDIRKPGRRVTALVSIASAAPDPDRSEAVGRALQIASGILEPLGKASALAGVLPHLDALAREQVAADIDLEALAAELPNQVAEIVPHLLPARARELLMLDRPVITAAVVRHTHDLPREEVRILWGLVNHRAGSSTRTDALESLRITVAWIDRLGGEAALEGACRAITDTSRWWP